MHSFARRIDHQFDSCVLACRKRRCLPVAAAAAEPRRHAERTRRHGARCLRALSTRADFAKRALYGGACVSPAGRTLHPHKGSQPWPSLAAPASRPPRGVLAQCRTPSPRDRSSLATCAQAPSTRLVAPAKESTLAVLRPPCAHARDRSPTLRMRQAPVSLERDLAARATSDGSIGRCGSESVSCSRGLKICRSEATLRHTHAGERPTPPHVPGHTRAHPPAQRPSEGRPGGPEGLGHGAPIARRRLGKAQRGCPLPVFRRHGDGEGGGGGRPRWSVCLARER